MPRNNKPQNDLVFHSALVQASPVRITVDDEPRWIDKKNNYVVDITIHQQNGPAMSVTYWAENNRCGEWFKGQKGRTFTISASGGGKGPAKETGQIIYVGESGANLPPAAPPPAAPPAPSYPPPQGYPPASGHTAPPPAAPPVNRPPPPTAEERTKREDRGLNDAKRHIARNETILKLVLRRAMVVKQEFEEFTAGLPEAHPHRGMKMSEELFRTTVATLLYGTESSGVSHDVPTVIDFKTLQPVRKPGTQPPPQPQQPPSPPPPPTCPTHGAPLDKDGKCQACEQEHDDVPF